MKQTLLTLAFLLCATFSIAQELKVKSFVHNEMNLEARVGGGRTDLNGKQCALIKVQVRDDIIDCTGGNVGEIETKGVVKKIFVSPDTRFLKFEFKYNYPLKVTFADYGISDLAEGGTYTLTLVDADKLPQQNVQQNAQKNVTHTAVEDSASLPAQSSLPEQQANSPSGSIIPITAGDVTFNMILVEGGTFTMGATAEQKAPFEYDIPAHQVTLSSYYIGETEVTQALWQAVMGRNPSYFKGDNLPVESVSWDDCQDFIKKLNGMTGRTFRLPTEAEWEFAARGGNKSRHTRYSGSKRINEVAWWTSNSKSKTHPVKSKKANELGIYDMSGNVTEWCQDWYCIYESSPQNNPVGPSTGHYRVHRGGSWDGGTRNISVSAKSSTRPNAGFWYHGLRLVLSELRTE